MADRYEKLEKIGEGSFSQEWQVKLRDAPHNSKSKVSCFTSLIDKNELSLIRFRKKDWKNTIVKKPISNYSEPIYS